jgi:biotin carboxyl carrier protein
MKFTLSLQNQEMPFATIDDKENNVDFLNSKGELESKNKLESVLVEVGLEKVDVTLKSEQDSQKESYYFRTHGEGEFQFATALGDLSIKAVRGSPQTGGAQKTGGKKVIKSSMPGKIFKILAKKGDRVELGQPILIIEAMKMENEIKSPMSGVVSDFFVSEGKTIESGEPLFQVQADE